MIEIKISSKGDCSSRDYEIKNASWGEVSRAMLELELIREELMKTAKKIIPTIGAEKKL